jgi:CRP-like cAMP-binding protein
LNLIEDLHDRINKANLWKKSLSLKRNDFLKVKGSTDTNLYFINEGTLRIFIEDEFEEHTIRLGYPGHFIAWLDSFISETPSDVYIQALKKCELQVVTKSDYMRFVQSDSDVRAIWQPLMEQFIYQQIEREKDILTRSPKERHERVLARSPQLFQEIPLKHIASYLNMAPETLSRLKKS